MISAGRYEGSAGVEALGHLESENPAIKPQRTVEVRDLEVNVADPRRGMDRSSGLRSWLDPGRVKILQHMFVPCGEWHWCWYESSRQLPTCSLSRLDLGAQYLGEACDFCAFCFNDRQEFRRRARAHGQPVTR